MLKDEYILVAGAAGSIGSELVKQLCVDNRVVMLDIDETRLFDLYEELKQDGREVEYRVGDIRDRATLEDLFRSRYKISIVFNAAAYKHVTPMEDYPMEAVQTNIIGNHNLMWATNNFSGAKKYVFISTDKAVNATSVMGASKRLGELMVKKQGAGFISVRFANVLGSRGSVIPIWQKQIDEGKSLTITHPDMERYFMTIEEAVELVIKAAEIGQGGEIFVLDMGKPVKIIDLAKEIIGKLGREVPIQEIGIRPGESMSEQLMFPEEQKIAVKQDNFYVIR